MSRDDLLRLEDVEHSIALVRAHVRRGDVEDDLVFDAVSARLQIIGEALKHVSPELLATEPGIPWSQVIRMRDRLAHRYFETSRHVLADTVRCDLDELETAVGRLRERAMEQGRE